MATLGAGRTIRMGDGSTLLAETPITAQAFMEVAALLPEIMPSLAAGSGIPGGGGRRQVLGWRQNSPRVRRDLPVRDGHAVRV